ncbi:hypothetical protein HPB52_001004 [Rhipicephalus sanguineus]|uniref:Tick transposon n=1 Tax=Rhipicephalus sanguineus TaxID=34632 RepID=A0A9D4P9Q5_RHISA|nr:hypothetical protein HPB52_001004 [Rhipicephalus sanguineus]
MPDRFLRPFITSGRPTLLGLDVPKVFNSMTHEAIAQQLAVTSPGRRNYTGPYLHGRTVERSPIGTPRRTLTNKCVPEGAVPVHFLFNFAMNQLPSSQDRFTNISHTLYVDEVTTWTTTSSYGHVEGALPQASTSWRNAPHERSSNAQSSRLAYG